MNSREVMQQALLALELSTPKPRVGDDDYAEQEWEEHHAAITALKAALAEPTGKDHLQVEPVAKVELMTTGGNAGLATRIVEIDDHLRERLRPGQMLYTHPAPQRQPQEDGAVCARCGGLVFDPVIPQQAKHDEVELLQADLDRHQQTIIEMGAMLRAIVNLIRGEPPEGESHSTHDAVELVRGLVMHNDLYVSAATHEASALKTENEALRDSCEAKADRIDRLGETVERLRAENEALARDYNAARDAHDKRQTENDALRAALAEPQEMRVPMIGACQACGHEHEFPQRQPQEPSRAMLEALQIIATPQRPDGTWNRDREACRQLAAEALGFHNKGGDEMSDLRTAAQQVVDEYEAGFVGLSLDKAVAALRAALAEPVQEPVAWMHPDDGRVIPAATMKIAVQDGGASLSSVRGYTIPLGPQRQPHEPSRELLEALRGYVNDFSSEDGMYDVKHYVKVFSEVIAKVEGKQ